MRKLFYLLIAVVAFASCSKLDGPNAKHDRLEGILLGKDTLQMYVGQVRQVPITTNPANYHTDSLRWKSSDTTIISISAYGLATAKKTGQVSVSVSNLSGSISGNIQVTVNPAPLDSLKMGVVAWYPFSGSAVDSSGNHFNGRVNGATLAENRFGTPNSAYHFDGYSNIAVDDAPGLRLRGTDFTINSWVKLDVYNYSLSSAVIDKRSPNGSLKCWYTGVDGTNGTNPAGLTFYGPGGGYPSITSNDTVKLHAWTMLTTVYNLSTHVAKLYINGVLSATSAPDIESPDGLSDAKMYIGSDNPQVPTYYNMTGSIDDIRIYNRMLSEHEISMLYIRAN